MQLVDNYKKPHPHHERVNFDLRLSIDNLIGSAEICDAHRLHHQQRVAYLSEAIGEQFGLNQDILRGLSISGSLHDLGLLRVPNEVLAKSTPLTEAEVALLRAHPQTGYEFLKQVNFPWPVAEIVLQHHEHVDGSGYPNGLRGRQIRIEARIICVSEAIEAITSNRPHRPASTVREAAEEVQSVSGALFDREVVDAFLDLIDGRRLLVKGWALPM